MYSTIKRLRDRGRRKPDRDIQSEPGVSGDLCLALCGALYELKVYDPGDSLRKPLVPELHDAELISMHNWKMLFRGFERGPDGAEWVQEWSARVVVSA